MNDSSKEKKQIKISRTALIIIISITVVIQVLFLFLYPQNVIIQNSDSKYFKAKLYFKIGTSLFISKSDKLYKKEKSAFKENSPNYKISFISLKQIDHIYIMSDEDAEEPEGNVKAKYLGKYKINASGHIGYLKLRAKGSRVYGTVKFPNWAKGSTEYLKGVKISKGKLKFIRSVLTKKAMRKTGATTYFKQTYYGTYLKKGKAIKGHYIRDGAKTSWEGKKI